MATKPIRRSIKKIIEEELDLCWQNYGKLIRDTDDEKYETTRAHVLDVIEGIDYEDWENVAWTAGFIAGLQRADKVIK